MFTVSAIVVCLLFSWYVMRKDETEDKEYEAASKDTRDGVLLLRIRQHLRAVALLLMGILIMLGIIADRLG